MRARVIGGADWRFVSNSLTGRRSMRRRSARPCISPIPVRPIPAAEDFIRAHPKWYHSIELAPGSVTPGRAPLAFWQEEVRALHPPNLIGKSVLEIGASDEFFSFAPERLGASRVVARDHYALSADMREWRSVQKSGHFSCLHTSHHIGAPPSCRAPPIRLSVRGTGQSCGSGRLGFHDG